MRVCVCVCVHACSDCERFLCVYVQTVNAFFLVISDCERLFSCMFRL